MPQFPFGEPCPPNLWHVVVSGADSNLATINMWRKTQRLEAIVIVLGKLCDTLAPTGSV